jgi:hypothetical protein
MGSYENWDLKHILSKEFARWIVEKLKLKRVNVSRIAGEKLKKQ